MSSQLARLLALVNVAMADAGIAVWESKYFYEYWRPITGIREADEGTGPSGLGDGNPGHGRRSELLAARRAGQQSPGAELHAAVPGLSVGTRRLRGRAVRDAAQLLRNRRHRLHVRVGRVQRRDARQPGQPAPADPAQLRIAVGSRGGERPEPDLSRHPLVVRQDRGDRAGTSASRMPCSGACSCRRAASGASGRGAPPGLRSGDAILGAASDGPGDEGRRVHERGGDRRDGAGAGGRGLRRGLRDRAPVSARTPGSQPADITPSTRSWCSRPPPWRARACACTRTSSCSPIATRSSRRRPSRAWTPSPAGA